MLPGVEEGRRVTLATYGDEAGTAYSKKNTNKMCWSTRGSSCVLQFKRRRKGPSQPVGRSTSETDLEWFVQLTKSPLQKDNRTSPLRAITREN